MLYSKIVSYRSDHSGGSSKEGLKDLSRGGEKEKNNLEQFLRREKLLSS